MELPTMLRDESLTRLLQGAAFGAAATAIVGFTWGGWVTGGTASKMADESSSKSVAMALSPMCVAKFNADADAPAQLVKLKATSSWQRDSFIDKGGWSILPGKKTAYQGVAEECAKSLVAAK